MKKQRLVIAALAFLTLGIDGIAQTEADPEKTGVIGLSKPKTQQVNKGANDEQAQAKPSPIDAKSENTGNVGLATPEKKTVTAQEKPSQSKINAKETGIIGLEATVQKAAPPSVAEATSQETGSVGLPNRKWETEQLEAITTGNVLLEAGRRGAQPLERTVTAVIIVDIEAKDELLQGLKRLLGKEIVVITESEEVKDAFGENIP